MARIYVTGFSCFGSVTCNPTEEIVNELAIYVEKQQQENDSAQTTRIIGTKYLEVSAASVKDWLENDLYKKLELASDHDVDSPIVVLHLGVDEKSDKIKLESTAYNEATFRIPDQSAWKPQGVPINSEEELDFCRTTPLPVGKLAESLSKYDVLVSQDAGRYVCNYTYFISLEEAAKRQNIYPLFVHVPLFSKVSKVTQLAFLEELFVQLGTCLVEKEMTTETQKMK